MDKLTKKRVVLYDRSLPALAQRFSGGFDYFVGDNGVTEGRSLSNPDEDVRVYLRGRFSEQGLDYATNIHLVRLLTDLTQKTTVNGLHKARSGMKGINTVKIRDEADGVRPEAFVRHAIGQTYRRAA